MKKVLFIATAMSMTLTASPQGVLSVSPGSQGTLPPVPQLSQADAGHVAALELREVGSDYYIRGPRVGLSFPKAETFGAQYYTIQEQPEGSSQWQDHQEYSDATGQAAIVQYGGTTSSAYFAFSQNTSYRLLLHGGSMDGYVSNEVTAPYSAFATRVYRSSDRPADLVVGRENGGDHSVTVDLYDANGRYQVYSDDDGYFLYQWYRRNPNTYEMTAIDGATQRTYTPTMDDWGYEIIKQTRGDNEHCSFVHNYQIAAPDQQMNTSPICHLPVKMNVSYFGDDGFILDTDYELPTPLTEHLFWKERESADERKAFANAQVSELSTGRYVIRMGRTAKELDNMALCLDDDLYLLGFTYIYSNGSTGFSPTIALYYYGAYLRVSPMHQGYPVAARVELLRRNLSGEWLVIDSRETDGTDAGGTAYFYDILGDGEVVVKVTPTDANLLTTYSGGAATAESALPVRPVYNRDCEPLVINLRSDATGITTAALDGNSQSTFFHTISGQRLQGQPTQRGLYIVGGKKRVVK